MVDYSPKYIEVMPGAARDQRLGLCEMEMDMFDAIIIGGSRGGAGGAAAPPGRVILH